MPVMGSLIRSEVNLLGTWVNLKPKQWRKRKSLPKQIRCEGNPSSQFLPFKTPKLSFSEEIQTPAWQWELFVCWFGAAKRKVVRGSRQPGRRSPMCATCRPLTVARSGLGGSAATRTRASWHCRGGCWCISWCGAHKGSLASRMSRWVWAHECWRTWQLHRVACSLV